MKDLWNIFGFWYRGTREFLRLTWFLARRVYRDGQALKSSSEVLGFGLALRNGRTNSILVSAIVDTPNRRL